MVCSQHYDSATRSEGPAADFGRAGSRNIEFHDHAAQLSRSARGLRTKQSDVLVGRVSGARAPNLQRVARGLVNVELGTRPTSRNGQHLSDASLLDRRVQTTGIAERARPVPDNGDAAGED